MRLVRILALIALCLAFTPTSALAVTGYDSAYSGESAFVMIDAGQTQSFQVFFSNTGTTTWAKGTATEVDLAACLADKVTCNAQDSTDSTWNSGWLSATRYATATQASVAPGSLATFAYNIKAPADATGTHRFNGDLVVASSGARIHPEGYYQDATVNAVGSVTGPTPTPTPGSTPFPSAPPATQPPATPTPTPLNFTISPWAYACGHTTFANPATAQDTAMATDGCPPGDIAGTATAAYNSTTGALALSKGGATSDDLAAGALVGGLTHVTTASFDVAGYCGAGAPRINVTTGAAPGQAGSVTHFYGCSANNTAGHVSITFANAASDGSGNGGVAPTDTVYQISFVQDELGDTTLTNIKFNGMSQ